MTLKYVRDRWDVTRVQTLSCALCGAPLEGQIGPADHIPEDCPAREVYAERGALLDGGPDPARVREAIHEDAERVQEAPA